MPETDRRPFCNRCLEEFPMAPDQVGPPRRWEMGWLYPLSRAPAAIRRRFKREDDNNHLCGNCYFDLTDEE